MHIINPQISVAMASYNGSQFILEQVESILSQTVMPFEIVIVDDASSDDTTRLIQSLSQSSKIPVRLIVNERNLGSTASFGRAILECKGDWIALADQDDVWLPNKLQTLIHKAVCDHCDAVFSDAELVDEDLRSLNKRLLDNSRITRSMRKAFRDGNAFGALMRYNIVTGATMMFRSTWKDRVTPVASGWVHDYWMALIIASSGRIGLCEEPLILYRQHGRNQIGANAGLSSELNRSFSKSREAYLVEANQFARIRESLEAKGIGNPSIIANFENKERFLRRRYEMRESIVTRMWNVILNILQGNYFKYGYGWRPMLKDVLLP